MSVQSFKVDGMSCGHCAAAVTTEVSKLDGVTNVDVDLAAGAVTVDSQQPIDPNDFAAAIAEAGFAIAQ